jgi:tripartite-type tricarboxylate transporter receptor subunit TctC
VHAAPDGYTLLWITQTNAINETLYSTLSFDFRRDIQPVASIVRVPAVSLPAKTVPEFIAYAKANPGKINMCSPGIGSANHIFGELFKMMAGVDLVHVPYRGSWFADLIGGQVQVTFNPLPASLGLIGGGKVRALAVTSAARQPVLPDIPAVSEFLPGYDATAWFGIGAPKASSGDIVAKLNREIDAGLADPKVKARLAELGGEEFAGSPVEFGRFIDAETQKWAKVIKFANIKAE